MTGIVVTCTRMFIKVLFTIAIFSKEREIIWIPIHRRPDINDLYYTYTLEYYTTFTVNKS